MKKMKVSGDTPQTPGFQKVAGRLGKPAKQISHEMVPGPHAIAASPGVQATKLSPADASGKGQIGLNIMSASKNGMGIS